MALALRDNSVEAPVMGATGFIGGRSGGCLARHLSILRTIRFIMKSMSVTYR